MWNATQAGEDLVAVVSMNRDAYHSQALIQRCVGARGIGGIVVLPVLAKVEEETKELPSLICVP